MTDNFPLPPSLAKTCSERPERMVWLERLPDSVAELERRWSLTLGAPFQTGICAWVAPAVSPQHGAVVLKLGMPHMEAEQEIAAMRFWNGDPTARLIDADDALNAMLLERCVPGTLLRTRPEPEQDVIITGLLKRMWRRPVAPHPFRPLSVMVRHWIESSIADEAQWPDAVLTREGLRVFEELARAKPDDVLLATDLHGGNVLAAEREPWLAIDPKPFVGDRAYDATQHLFNCKERLRADPMGLIARVAGLLGVDRERVRLWVFARLASEPRDWSRLGSDPAGDYSIADAGWRASLAIARTLAP
jgi:streptomycin 6-kinase